MATPLSTFACDRSPCWILVPGVASTRQIEIRNESDAPVEAHLRVERPATVSLSPAVMTIPPRHSRVADVIFLANWSPTERTVALSFHDVQGNALGTFAHDVVAADNADCNISLDLRPEVLVENALVGLKLWCTVLSRSSTPRRFEIDFTSHPALRLPEHKTITLGPGETSAFEVPVQWNRAVRDVAGWNHPRAIEAFVPVSDGRRSAVLPWDRIEQRLAPYMTVDDRQAKIVSAPPEQRTDFLKKTPGELKYEELVELKRLEQGVVAATPARTLAKPASEERTPQAAARRSPIATVVTIAFALVALVLAFLFFLRPPEHQATDGPIRVTPLKLSPAPILKPASAKTLPKAVAQAASATPVWSSLAQATVEPNAATTAREPAAAAVARTAPAQQPLRATVASVDRNQVVTLS
ncbi:MAG TPA: hypothetical protein VEJ41_09725, partial [Candidatus Acidoferrales bacterium]|nr:hypothetical protein [Candidatus Acidoferrales bacterium]